MQKIKKLKTIHRVVVVMLFVAGITGSFFNNLSCSFADDAITFQELAAQILKEDVGDDNSGQVYTWGLTAKYTGVQNLVPGEGKYKNLLKFLPAIRWYDPTHYFEPRQVVEGEFEGQECVLCHTIQTPGIVKDWKRSGHSKPAKTKSMETEAVVTCDKCHGNNHKSLKMPDLNVCGECHMDKVAQHKAGGAGSHGHAFHRDILENGTLINKPAEEMYGCIACHATIENRCDGCHTRHRFAPSEARRSETCGVCHMGVDHYDYETWSSSYHGKIYKTEGDEWDWNRRLGDWGKRDKDGQVPAPRTPTCAFCHMPRGTHNIQKALTVESGKGRSLVDRGAPQYAEKRKEWIRTCQTCHSPRFAQDQLEAMDAQVKLSFTKVREAFKIVLDLKNEGLLDPMPDGLAPDWFGHNTFSLLPEGEARFYNVSKIEKMVLEMLAYHSTAVYKSAAHFSMNDATNNRGAFAMDRSLVDIKDEASKLRRFARLEEKAGINHVPYDFWEHGEYTDLLMGKKRQDGDVLPETECLHEDVKCIDAKE